MEKPVTVRKLGPDRAVLWSYEGRVLERAPAFVKLEARFDRPTMDLGYALFETKDRFVEHFYADRWYNIFEVHAAADDRLKGWYCNIAEPARIGEAAVEQVDLALDLWVSPDGAHRVLDREEFDSLPLDPETRDRAEGGLRDLLARLDRRLPPFDVLP
jgi:hypothetical protein